jgi:hypothetical protein
VSLADVADKPHPAHRFRNASSGKDQCLAHAMSGRRGHAQRVDPPACRELTGRLNASPLFDMDQNPAPIDGRVRVRRRFLAIFALTAILGSGVLASSIRPPTDPLTPGASFPDILLATWREDARTALPTRVDLDAVRPTVIVFVRSGCSFCKEQLTDMERNAAFLDARWVIVTP